MKRKKTWLLDQRLIDRVKKIYRASTETEAVSRAMREVLVQDEIRKALRQTAGKIPRIQKVF